MAGGLDTAEGRKGTAGAENFAARDERGAGLGSRVKGEAPGWADGGLGANLGAASWTGAGAGVSVACKFRPRPKMLVTLSGTATVFCPGRRPRRAGSNEARICGKGRLTNALSWVALS